jgi:hypothetical protein
MFAQYMSIYGIDPAMSILQRNSAEQAMAEPVTPMPIAPRRPVGINRQ